MGTPHATEWWIGDTVELVGDAMPLCGDAEASFTAGEEFRFAGVNPKRPGLAVVQLPTRDRPRFTFRLEKLRWVRSVTRRSKIARAQL